MGWLKKVADAARKIDDFVVGAPDRRSKSKKRTLNPTERKELFKRSGRVCENPGCKKKLTLGTMEVGHMLAASKGGRATLANTKCLCADCNKKQGTKSWKQFLEEERVEDRDMLVGRVLKRDLDRAPAGDIKRLAKLHGVSVKGRVRDDWSETKLPPTKKQYTDRLRKILPKLIPTSADPEKWLKQEFVKADKL